MKDGKKVCNELKAVRKQIADANGIEYNPTECTHQGECLGTCPKCESEVRYLENELNMRRLLGKAVVVAGLGLAVSSCACSPEVEQPMGDVGCEVDTTVNCNTDSVIGTDDGKSTDSIEYEMGEVEAGHDLN